MKLKREEGTSVLEGKTKRKTCRPRSSWKELPSLFATSQQTCNHVGTAAPGRPAIRQNSVCPFPFQEEEPVFVHLTTPSAEAPGRISLAELRSAGRPRAAVPTYVSSAQTPSPATRQ